MESVFLTSLFIAYGIIFVAELGDKTQLIVLTLATKGFDKKMLSLGATVGFAVIVFLGGIIAMLLANYIDLNLLSLISGVIFLIIGSIQIIKIIKDRKKGVCETNIVSDNEIPKLKSTNSFLIGLFSIVIMELGDKTQLMTIILASTSASIVGTLLGSWLALSSLAIIGAIAGEYLSKKLSKEKIDIIASALFVVIGILIIVLSF